jgi:hypothetical protein
MALWDKFFGSRDKAPAVRGAPAQVRSPTPVNPAPAGPASIAQIMLEAKRGRFAHLAKHHELAGEWSEADANYAALADAQQRTRGEADPDLASVAFEIAHLNHRQEFERAPGTAEIYASLGRGQLVTLHYKLALNIRSAALSPTHPALGQSYFGLGESLLDLGRPEDRQEAGKLLSKAYAIQRTASDPLPKARTALRIADLATVLSDDRGAAAGIAACQLALKEARSAFFELVAAQEALAAAPRDAQARCDATIAARDRQAPFADPYFIFLFDLLSTGPIDLLEMALDLHRQQYERDLLEANVDVFESVAVVMRRDGDASGAADLVAAADSIRANGPAWLRLPPD